MIQIEALYRQISAIKPNELLKYITIALFVTSGVLDKAGELTNFEVRNVITLLKNSKIN